MPLDKIFPLLVVLSICIPALISLVPQKKLDLQSGKSFKMICSSPKNIEAKNNITATVDPEIRYADVYVGDSHHTFRTVSTPDKLLLRKADGHGDGLTISIDKNTERVYVASKFFFLSNSEYYYCKFDPPSGRNVETPEKVEYLAAVKKKEKEESSRRMWDRWERSCKKVAANSQFIGNKKYGTEGYMFTIDGQMLYSVRDDCKYYYNKKNYSWEVPSTKPPSIAWKSWSRAWVTGDKEGNPSTDPIIWRSYEFEKSNGSLTRITWLYKYIIEENNSGVETPPIKHLVMHYTKVTEKYPCDDQKCKPSNRHIANFKKILGSSR